MKVKAGSRGSKLALRQTEIVIEKLKSLRNDLEVQLEIIKTKGDKILNSPLSRIGGKGIFVKEIEEEILKGNIHFAVHSLKDLPTELPDGLMVGAVLEREDPRDAFVSFEFQDLNSLPQGARVGTSSLRRKAQLLFRRKDLEVLDLRGNVDTRVRKVKEGQVHAAIMAYAGLKRMGLEGTARYIFEPEDFIPQAGQGAIVVEVREDCPIMDLLSALDHKPTRMCIEAERAFLETIEGGCQVPAAAFATAKNGVIRLTAFVSDEDGSKMIKDSIEGTEPVEMGRLLGKRFLERGAGKIIEEVRKRRERFT